MLDLNSSGDAGPPGDLDPFFLRSSVLPRMGRDDRSMKLVKYGTA